MTAPLLGLAALCAVLCVLLLVAVFGWRRDRARLTPPEPVTYPSSSGLPVYDQTAHDLAVWPDQWSAGDETDVAQAIRISDGRTTTGTMLPRLRRVQ